MRTANKIVPILAVALATALPVAEGRAQCPDNLVANGDFTAGAVYGSMPSASVSDWSLITNSPQVVNTGCATPNAVQMWGNLVVGESIKQSLASPFQAGRTYRITIRYKFLNPGPAPAHQVRFRLAASAASPTVYPPTGGASYDVIGVTPLTSSTSCITYTFPDWTAPNNAGWLAVNPENTSAVNDGAHVSWGTIDDICIVEVGSCPGSVVANGDFSAGLVYGSMPTAAVSNWSLLTNSPQVVNTGCDTPAGAVQMWGNLVVGESIKQSGVGFEAGKTYSITIRYKYLNPAPAPAHEVAFRLAATASDPSVYPPTGGAGFDVIGVTPLTSSLTCVAYTFPNWTAPNDADWLTINPENTSSVDHGDFVSWGTIDDICIREVCPGNVVTNGDFSAGLVYGSMPTATVSNWSLLTNSPQVVNTGCDTPAGAVQMWGNLVVGESVKHALSTPILAGTIYRVTIRYKFLNPGPPPAHEVAFRLAASQTEPSVYPPTGGASYDVIGVTPLTSSTTCVSYTFPDWTAPNNAGWLAVNPENTSSVNDGAQVSWGIIDDLCINVVGGSDPTSVPAATALMLAVMSMVMLVAGYAVIRRRAYAEAPHS